MNHIEIFSLSTYYMSLQDILPIESIISSFDRYVVIKKSEEFPLYKINQDIDILTTKLDKNINVLLHSYDTTLFSHKIEVVVPNQHYHIDLYLLSDPKRLHFRFDMFSCLNYKRFSVNQAIIEYIILNRISDSSIYIPKLEDDLSLRYAEYIEYKSNPKKEKHLIYTNKFSNVNFHRVKEGDTNCLLNYKSGTNPYYSFIIWSHGIPDIYDIVQMLKQNVSCEIKLITKKKYSNISEFISKVYALELHNKNHIIGKTNYLRSLGNEYFYILIKKHDYNPKQYGTGKDMIYADEDVVNFKWLVRTKYNPKLPDPKAQPSPSLPPGISHHHVLHATDTENETAHLTKVITNMTNAYYEDVKVHDACIPYHIKGQFHIRDINISELKITVHKSLENKVKVGIQETPHYAYVSGDKSTYIQYYQRFMGGLFTDDHTGLSFDRLIKSFNPNTYKYEKANLILINKNSEVLDGVHRLAILYKHNVSNIRVLSL